ncbi:MULTISPECIES: hypothetical protein [unclassified Mycobacterium]|uniref:hypothetical protein n=1 Tax=unclassified Mycobacterium TaxID=2642494 RepID=UPI000FABDD2E|nr:MULTISPECIES: hypothetical protein [unclassified Mycobacterium]MDP7705225.1 hypothetical protein [Mycobacterium sp. TY815]MDP7723548.1 hypothetical protein [Mycobacterium sp. TY814]RUP02460.1 MAG: hypothetical protein EKK34_23985 [Mycobacterium sp.]
MADSSGANVIAAAAMIAAAAAAVLSLITTFGRRQADARTALATGEIRWRKTFSCVDPAGTQGVFGQFGTPHSNF